MKDDIYRMTIEFQYPYHVYIPFKLILNAISIANINTNNEFDDGVFRERDVVLNL